MQPTPRTVTAADGTDLRLWELPPGDVDASGGAGDPEAGATAVLHVHGSITNSRALFAPPVEGDDSYSWLAATARTGRTALALDIRGYGDSDRLPELDEPPGANDPPVRAPTAARDIAAAVADARDRFETVHLLGVSWGTMTCGHYLAHHADGAAVDSLTQVAPVHRPPWTFEEVTSALGVDAGLDAYYYQYYDEVAERQGGDDALFQAVWQAQVESNQGVDEETYVAQSGALADTAMACEGETVYDAGAVEVPALVVRGTDDGISVREDALGLYDELGATAERKEYAELASADHYAMHGPRRQALYALVNAHYDRVEETLD
ncbi:MAG: alpha/beta fold hydrolase [Haloglomus sp.]